MCAAALQGDKAEAELLDGEMAALHRDLFLEANPIPVKWAMAELGRVPMGIRLPLTWLSEKHHEPVRQAMLKANAL
jgi:4-hydroxy-tetrahydrodipicolinate synthase